MELKVWVEGIQRVVCGVCDRTTCQDVVYALAHATGKTGRFTLIERWRSNERLLAPHEHPLKVLMKWGEYSSDVHFILQRTALDATTANRNALQPNNKSSRPTKTSVDPLHGFTPPMTSPPPHGQQGASSSAGATPSPSKDLKKSLTFSGGVGGGSPAAGDRSRLPLNVGVVRGVPKRSDNNGELNDHHHIVGQNGRSDWADKSSSYASPSHSQVPPASSSSHYQSEKNQSPSSNDGGGQLVYPRYDPPLYGRVRLPAGSNGSSNDAHYSSPPPPPLSSQHYQQQDSSPQNDSVRFPPPYRNPPPPFAGGSRQPPPPPYREPPRPSPLGGGGGGRGSSPYRSSPAPSAVNAMTPSPGRSTSTPPRPSPVRYDMNVQPNDDSVPSSAFDGRDDQSRRSRRNLRLDLSGGNAPRTPSPPSDPQQAQLIQRVNRQRGALDEQQEKLIQLEQELLGWEEQLHRRLDEERQQLNRELSQLEDRCRQQENQLSDLYDVEIEWEQVCREGKDLTEELARLQTDVSSLDSQLNECEPTLRLLKADVSEAEEHLVKELESELARVRADLDSAGQEEHDMNQEDQTTAEELAQSESQAKSLRTQMDQLTQEIKQANLQSLSIAPADDLKILLEGHNKTGHSRRMLGSPRQLENPVPTNKNPHGVWV